MKKLSISRLRLTKLDRANILTGLEIIKFFMLIILAIAFINFNMRLSEEVIATKEISATQEKTLASQKKAVEELKRNDNSQLASLNNHINCIVALFAQPNRANLTITNIQDCQITSTPSRTSPTPSNNAQPKSATTTPTQTSNQSQTPPADSTPSPKQHPLPFLCSLTVGILGC